MHLGTGTGQILMVVPMDGDLVSGYGPAHTGLAEGTCLREERGLHTQIIEEIQQDVRPPLRGGETRNIAGSAMPSSINTI